MSASEDSELDENHGLSSSFASHQPAQVQSFAPSVGQSSDPGPSDHDSELRPYIDNQPDSDDSFLPPSDESHGLDVERSHDHGSLDEPVDPLAAEESYYTRPNRYYGPASTWRSWTKDARDVAESLELSRAQDLSIHLYNAHALRLQTQRLQESASRKRRRGSGETNRDEGDIFVVPKVWTAWPMPPDQVPRNCLNPTAADNSPSRELEECLISTTTKAARERWNAREWEMEENLRQRASPEESGEQNTATADFADDEEAPETQMSGSEAFAEADSSPENQDDASGGEMYGIDPAAKPTPLADDDKARRLLLPSTRHIISKLDHLLMALHRSRQPCALSTFEGEDDGVTSSATDADRQASASARTRRKRSRAQRASSISTVDTEASIKTSSSRRRKGVWKEGSVPRNRKSKGLGLRDWSDVLGMAALTGWNEDVVARASKRCSELLGEDMLFRSFHEAEHEEEKSFFTERLASGQEPLEVGEAGLGRIPQIQRRDGYEDEDEDEETAGDLGLRYPCPIDSCPRHKTPFHTPGNLKQHMNHSHKQLEGEDGKVRIIEAVVSDGKQVFCPVPTCHRSREPFTRGSKLYLHVRKMHPEVNIDDLKKLESQRRREARGKRTRQKTKSPYECD